MRPILFGIFWLALLLALAFATLLLALGLIGSINDKALHAGVFALLALLGSLAYPRISPVLLFISLAAFGGLIELVQLCPVLGRDAEWRDWKIDCIAAGGALIIIWALRRTFRFCRIGVSLLRRCAFR